ncbi:nuclear pore complex protein Nup153-like [Daktulosphaira vitifoliae]|uniref:nuclear pore complex protein Nup153-like n=1 Tax=Daktulosphaira vitifoliae TaxID=58002 RepID=UPI0021AA043B|nr:nuclear pore complex protein Nup153-like [Daktulosphaira vitifoliae]
MKPYDKSNSFMRRVTKRVSELIPGTTWMNKLLKDTQSNNDPSTSEYDEQPPVKKLCTPNNTFIKCTNRSDLNTTELSNSSDKHKNSNITIQNSGISVPYTSSTIKQYPSFTNQTNSTFRENVVNNPLKRKSEETDYSNINQQSPSKPAAFNFASSTPALLSTNKSTNSNINLKKSYTSDRSSITNDFSTPPSLKHIMKLKNNDSNSLIKFGDASKRTSSPSFRWDTFVNYGELSERQKLFAQKSPLNCSQVVYGGGSAHSNLSKILGNTPPIHRKAILPISPATNNEIRTTSSILLKHMSAKDKVIEENKYIIQPKVNIRHRAEKKSIPIKAETTVCLIDISPEKSESQTTDIQHISRDTNRKLRANISKKSRGLQSNEFELPSKVELPNVSLSVPILPSIKLTSDDSDDEFTFNQPLTLEQFTEQVVEKTFITHNNTPEVKYEKSINLFNTKISNQNISDSSSKPISQETKSSNNSKNDTETIAVIKSDKIPISFKFNDASKQINMNSSSQMESSNLSSSAFISKSPVSLESNKKNVLSVTANTIKNWSCDTCWVSNDSDKVNCIACQTPKAGVTQKTLQLCKPSTWTCETCWVPNKSENDTCVACQSLKSGVTKKTSAQKSSSWKCNECWVINKNEDVSCISCGTKKTDSNLENKLQSTSQFKFGLNNNKLDNSGFKFKFGLDNSKINEPTSEFKFGLNNSKSELPVNQFKFGELNNDLENKKIESPVSGFKLNTNSPKTENSSFGTFKFGVENKNDAINNTNSLSNSNNATQPTNKFMFGFSNKSDHSDKQVSKQSNISNTPIMQFKFGSGNIEPEKSDKQPKPTCEESSTSEKPTNQLKLFFNNKTDSSPKSVDLKNGTNNQFFDPINQLNKTNSQINFGTVISNCNNNLKNSSSNVEEKKTEESSTEKISHDEKKDKVDTKQFNFGMSSSKLSSQSNAITAQIVNGHAQSNEVTNESTPNLIKTSQMFTFGSLANPEQIVPPLDEQRKIPSFSFGSTKTEINPFSLPISTSNNFGVSTPVFGTSNQSKPLFGSATSSSSTVNSTVPVSSFTFGSITQPTNNFFSKSVNDEKSGNQVSNTFTTMSNSMFSFGSQSQPVFSVSNSDTHSKPFIQTIDQPKTSSNLFGQATTKTAVKLDPNAPISINFTGGTRTQFTAQPETSEPPTKRKILKPVRRIR